MPSFTISEIKRIFTSRICVNSSMADEKSPLAM